MSPKNIAILIVLAFLLIFLLQNTQVVEIKLLFWKISMSRALMLLGIFFFGFIGGWLLKGLKAAKRKE